MINGIVTIYKEAGFTSHDVVAKLRGIVKQKKIGHTGTLDPDAVGVLPVCFGNATKLCDLITDKSKEYEACMKLGVTTDTQDLSGKVLTESAACAGVDAVRAAIMGFVGGYEQIPPMYSAIKVNGKKLYELAREGKEIARQPRHVDISFIEILDMELPYVRFLVGCSKGTYIRALCADIGEKLGCGAALASLKRTRVGNFRIEQAITLPRVEELVRLGGFGAYVAAPDSVFMDCAGAVVKPEAGNALANGNKLSLGQLLFEGKADFKDGDIFRIYDAGHVFKALYVYVKDGDIVKPYKMFL